MRPAALFYALSLVAFTVFTTATAAPRSSNTDVLPARAPSPVVEARAPAPEPSGSRLLTRGLRKRKQRVMSEEDIISDHLCPQPLRVCPLSGESRPSTMAEWIDEGFECVNHEEDLYSCGGCSTVDEQYVFFSHFSQGSHTCSRCCGRHDCTKIEGALNVACTRGSCRVDSCTTGYTRSLDGKSCIKA